MKAKIDSQELQNEFERWAFGSAPQSYNMLTLYSWNSHHGDLYFANPNEIIDESIQRMVDIWWEQTQQKESYANEASATNTEAA